MAAVTGEFLKVSNEVKALGAKLKAVDANDGIKFDLKNYANERVMFIVKNIHASDAKDVTVCKPTTGGYAATDTDLVLSDLAAGEEAVIWVETAKFANNDGSILIKGESADIKVAGVVIG